MVKSFINYDHEVNDNKTFHRYSLVIYSQLISINNTIFSFAFTLSTNWTSCCLAQNSRNSFAYPRKLRTIWILWHTSAKNGKRMMFLRKMALPGTKAITSSSFEMQRSQKHKFVIGHCQWTAENNSLQKMRGKKPSLYLLMFLQHHINVRGLTHLDIMFSSEHLLTPGTYEQVNRF